MVGVPLAVAERTEPRNDHVVIRILQKAEAALGQLGRLLKDRKRRLAKNAEVDLRVGELKVAQDLQAQLGKLTKGGDARAHLTAQHHALAALPLSDADIEVAVLIEGKEKVRDEVICLLAAHAGGTGALIVGAHKNVEAADIVMVFPLQPEGVMQDAEGLERLAEGTGAVARHSLQHLGNIIPSLPQCLLAIAVGKRENGVDLHPLAIVGLSVAGHEPVTDNGGIIGANIGDVAKLVDMGTPTHRLPLGRSEDIGQIGHRADKDDLLALGDIRHLLPGGEGKAVGHALTVVKPLGGIALGKRGGREGAAGGVVTALYDVVRKQGLVHRESP